MSLPAEITKSITSKKAIYSRLEKLLGKGSKTVDIYRIRTSKEDYKLLELSRKWKKSRAVSDSFSSYVAKLSRLSGLGFCPELIYHDDESMLVEWIDGETVNNITANKEVVEKIAMVSAGTLSEIKELDIILVNEQTLTKLEELEGRGLLTNIEINKIKKLFNENIIAIPEVEYEGLGFSDAALKNYILTPDNAIKYIDIYGINRTRISHSLMRHLFFFQSELRAVFLNEFLKIHKSIMSENYLPFYYCTYLIRIANSKSVNARFLNKRYRMKRAYFAIDRLRRFLKYIENNKLSTESILQGKCYR